MSDRLTDVLADAYAAEFPPVSVPAREQREFMASIVAAIPKRDREAMEAGLLLGDVLSRPGMVAEIIRYGGDDDRRWRARTWDAGHMFEEALGPTLPAALSDLLAKLGADR